MSAVMSDDGRYRFELRRRVSLDEGCVCFGMLNPSKADAERNDPTIRRCIGFARDWGYGELVVVNLFPLKATNPRDLVRWLEGDPAHLATVGQRNGEYIGRAISEADLAVAAWGASPLAKLNGQVVRALAEQHGDELHVLGLTKHGAPRHPLYVPAATRPVRWASDREAR